MKAKLVGVAALATTLCVTTAAFANWQYTSWGMTASQVIDASAGAVYAYQGKPSEQVGGKRQLLAAGNYHSGSIDFNARFYFDRDGLLNLISLTPKTYDCAALKAALLEKYGTPKSFGDSSFILILEWVDGRNNNRINFYDMIDCVLNYTPVGDPDAGGL